jgi:hypothetical protein
MQPVGPGGGRRRKSARESFSSACMYSRLHACPGGCRALSHKSLSQREKRPIFYFLPRGPKASDAAEPSIGYGPLGLEEHPGRTIGSVMNAGCAFVHATASAFVSKNLSTTRALRWFGVRPDRRAASRLTTAGPVSTAVQAPSGKRTLQP